VTRDTAKGVMFLKVVNASSIPHELNIKLTGAGRVEKNAKLVRLSAQTTGETNTLWEPTKIVPVESSIADVSDSFRYTFPPYSINIIEFHTK
jgi:alpha-N-arabinofuranosidase